MPSFLIATDVTEFHLRLPVAVTDTWLSVRKWGGTADLAKVNFGACFYLL